MYAYPKVAILRVKWEHGNCENGSIALLFLFLNKNDFNPFDKPTLNLRVLIFIFNRNNDILVKIMLYIQTIYLIFLP